MCVRVCIQGEEAGFQQVHCEGLCLGSGQGREADMEADMEADTEAARPRPSRVSPLPPPGWVLLGPEGLVGDAAPLSPK